MYHLVNKINLQEIFNNSGEFDIDSIPIYVNWSYKEDTKITFKEQRFVKLDTAVLKEIVESLVDGQKLKLAIQPLEFFYEENDDIFNNVNMSGNNEPYVESPAILNHGKIMDYLKRFEDELKDDDNEKEKRKS